MESTLYAGVDLHKKFSMISIVNEKGEKVKQAKVENLNEKLIEFFDEIKEPLEIGVESTFNSYWFSNLLERDGRRVHIGNARRMKAIGSGAAKTDKIDAEIIAQLTRSNMLPKIVKPTQSDLQKKEEVRIRFFLVKMRTQVKNKIHSYLLRNNLKHPYHNLFGKGGMKWLKEEGQHMLPEHEKRSLKELLETYEVLEKKIESQTKVIETKYGEQPEIQVLKSIPEIGTYKAVLLLGEIGDIKRFKTGKHLVSYFGMCPRVYQSADKCYGGHITRQGSKYARWAIGESVQKLEKSESQMGAQYRRLEKRVGKNKAKVAMGQKLVKVIHHCLTTGELYNPFPQKKSNPTDLKAANAEPYRSQAISAECERTSSDLSMGN